MGRLSKSEATKSLEMKPIRFWQLTQQAVAGMTVGLLTQPRYRKNDPQNNEQLEIKQLKAKILELEKVNKVQMQLIEILKSMPGCQGVTLKDGKTKKVPLRGEKKGGEKLNCSTSGEPAGDFNDIESNHPHAEDLEEKLQQ